MEHKILGERLKELVLVSLKGHLIAVIQYPKIFENINNLFRGAQQKDEWQGISAASWTIPARHKENNIPP